VLAVWQAGKEENVNKKTVSETANTEANDLLRHGILTMIGKLSTATGV